MTKKAWDGLPINPSRNGRHRLVMLGHPILADWNAGMKWYRQVDNGVVFSPLEISRMRFSHYVGPVDVSDNANEDRE